MSTRGGWRVALRLARREAARRKAQTALMLVLICLPVVAVTAAAIVWRTQDVSSAEGVDRRMGSAQALVEASGQSEVIQSFDPETGNTSPIDSTMLDEPPTTDDVRALVGPGRAVQSLDEGGIAFATDKGFSDAETVATDLTSPLVEGLFEDFEGAWPPGPGEVVVNRSLAERGPGIGETLTFTTATPEGEIEGSLEVVGIAEDTESRGFPLAVGVPDAFGPVDRTYGRWLVGGDPIDWSAVRDLNQHGLLVSSRAVLTDPPPASEIPPELQDLDGGADETTLTVLGLVVAMVLIEVVLLAGPAFAVRARAQAHALALVAASGGTPRQARRTILATGVVVGVLGGAVGVVVGVASGAAAVPVAQLFNDTRFGPFEVPWLILLVVAGFGLLSAMLAAVVPAHSASRQDPVAVLAGRRGEGRPSLRSPLLGLVLIGVGIAAAVLGSIPGSTSPLLVGGSAILAVVGMIFLVPVAVVTVARLAARLPLSLRFAARDAARHRTRTVPAVAAVGATVAGVVALGIAVSSQEAANEQRYTPMLPSGYASINLGTDVDRTEVDAVIARNLPGADVVEVEGLQTSRTDAEYEFEFSDDDEPLFLSYWSTIGSPYLVGKVAPAYLGMSDASRAAADEVLAAGGVVLVDNGSEGGGDIPAPELSGSTAVVQVSRWEADGEAAEPVATATLPAVVVPASDGAQVLAIFAPGAAESLGDEVAHLVDTVSLLLPAGMDGDVEQDMAEEFATLTVSPYLYVERGYQPDEAVRIVQGVLALLGLVMMLGGTLTATFLALSDARPDLATMAAVGARSRTRRRVAASYALVVGGVGALLGAVVGFIPGVAISRPLTQDFDSGATVLAVPWPLIAVVVVGLPLVVAAAVGLSARGRLPLVARID